MRSLVLTLTLVVVAALVMPPGSAAAAMAARGWLAPVDGPVLRAFSVGPERYAAGQHRGVDLGAPPGTRVLAACGGRVAFSGRVPRGGRTVTVRCGPLVATYQHLGDVAVRRGQAVVAGGRIGTAGRARPRPHVHLGARDAATGAYVDPLALFRAAPRLAPPPLPLGPAPAARPPLALGPSPEVPRPLRHAPELPAAHPAAPRPRPRPALDRLPWPVWLGLALVALGLPLGGFVTARRRLRRVPAPVPQTAA